MGPIPEGLWEEVRGLCSGGSGTSRGNRSKIRTQTTPMQPRLRDTWLPHQAFQLLLRVWCGCWCLGHIQTDAEGGPV